MSTSSPGANGIPSHAQVSRECSSPDPWLSARFEPDFLVPVQFFDLTRRRALLDGETRLVFAVLEDAVRCYLRNVNSTRSSEREQFAEVLRWFEAGAGSNSPFSFEYVCDVLGIDAGSLRSRLSLLSVEDLPTKQMRSVGRRQVVRAGRSSRKRPGMAIQARSGAG
jgi:hypothetical protein